MTSPCASVQVHAQGTLCMWIPISNRSSLKTNDVENLNGNYHFWNGVGVLPHLWRLCPWTCLRRSGSTPVCLAIAVFPSPLPSPFLQACRTWWFWGYWSTKVSFSTAFDLAHIYAWMKYLWATEDSGRTAHISEEVLLPSTILPRRERGIRLLILLGWEFCTCSNIFIYYRLFEFKLAQYVYALKFNIRNDNVCVCVCVKLISSCNSFEN